MFYCSSKRLPQRWESLRGQQWSFASWNGCGRFQPSFSFEWERGKLTGEGSGTAVERLPLSSVLVFLGRMRTFANTQCAHMTSLLSWPLSTMVFLPFQCIFDLVIKGCIRKPVMETRSIAGSVFLGHRKGQGYSVNVNKSQFVQNRERLTQVYTGDLSLTWTWNISSSSLV